MTRRNTMLSLLLLLSASTTTDAFSPSSVNQKRRMIIMMRQQHQQLHSQPPESPNDNGAAGAGETLILSAHEIAQQMAKVRRKMPTSEADYLAAARARANAKVPSVNQKASDEDWHDIAEHQKKQVGYEAGVAEQEGLSSTAAAVAGAVDDPDWRAAEQGNDGDSLQIIVPTNDNEDEPQLLL
eukprot:CAMPEP_0168744992 /NCGR_PEP_ID=MMETSP0724-20121128/14381_1 /TAXON_ID=265536 /ORGANISM="Amphiprora sp., Strain CCMP467" /LENGTH=182 /DNA_ID=CAMNT_0008792677 /DNA_START=62 /DNA_END=613 /DNA_ORIENTATION=-